MTVKNGRSDGRKYHYDFIELTGALDIAILVIEIEIQSSTVRSWQADCRQALELLRQLRDKLTDPPPNGGAMDYVNRARC